MPTNVTETHHPFPAPIPTNTDPIDRSQLWRMARGDSLLERELLQLFCRQAPVLVARMQTAPPAFVSALACTLKKSARSIGAWQVTRAAEAVELADGVAAEAEAAQSHLAAAVDAARSFIAELLAAS